MQSRDNKVLENESVLLALNDDADVSNEERGMVNSPSVYFDSPDVYLSSLNLRKEISVKIQWMYKWNPSLTKITSPISMFTLSLSFVSHRANRLISGGTPSGELTFGRKDRNLYIHTHAKGASQVSPPVLLISSPVILCLRARGDGCIYCCNPGFHREYHGRY